MVDEGGEHNEHLANSTLGPRWSHRLNCWSANHSSWNVDDRLGILRYHHNCKY